MVSDVRQSKEFDKDARSGQYSSTQLAKKYGITIRNVGDFVYYRKIHLPRHVLVNEAFFETQHPDMAYVVGWLAAGNCLQV